jgi:phosphoenolpyruvate-protein kinase (PTS system EI component)
MQFKGRFLVKNEIKSNMKYQAISSPLEFKACDCIVVKYLNPSLALLLSNIQLIITENGSVLSHAAIVARDYKKSVILVDGEIFSKLPKKGKIMITEKGDSVIISVI